MQIPRIRRPQLTYANVASTLALMLAVSTGGAYAHGKVGSWHLKDNAVKSRHIGWQQVKQSDLAKRSVATNRIKPRAVTRGKLAPNARTRIIHYFAGGHDFGDEPIAGWILPASVSPQQMVHSSWTAQARLVGTNAWVTLPGPAFDGDGVYALATGPSNREVGIQLVSGSGDEFDRIRLVQILRTGTASATPGFVQ